MAKALRGVRGVVLERLDEVEVSTFTLRETILTVKLELSGNNRVHTPTVHVKGSLGKNECTGIGDTDKIGGSNVKVRISVTSCP